MVVFVACSFTQTNAQIAQDENDFIVSVSGKSGGAISYAELSGQQLTLNKEGYSVEEFTLVYTCNVDDLCEFYTFGNQFLQSWDSMLQTMIPGQSVFLKNIKIRGLDGSVRVKPFVKFILM